MLIFVLVVLAVLISIVLIKRGQVIHALVVNVICAGVYVGYPLLALIPAVIIIYCVYLLWSDREIHI